MGGDLSNTPEFNLYERLAVLEERTRPKKKGILETLKDYGGVVALSITIIYSWPLGVWDRFVATPEQKKAEEIQRLKDVLSESTDLIAESGRSLSMISNPEIYDLVARAFSTKLALLLSKHKDGFLKKRDAFSPEELIVIGLDFQYLYQIGGAITFFEAASRKSPSRSLPDVEARRQLGKSYFMLWKGQDVEKGRMYGSTVKEISNSADTQSIGQEITLRSEWGFFELTTGDWKCGNEQIARATNMLKNWQYVINDQGNMARLLQAKVAGLVRRPGQPANGCS